MAISRSKFYYIAKDEISEYVNNGEIDQNDIIYTTDTHENVIIGNNLEAIPIRARIYRFKDVETAEETLNNTANTYEGQLVAILWQKKYVGYIVNRNHDGKFYVTPLSVYGGQVDYDTLGNRPIINIQGTIDSPVTVDLLSDGTYKIQGQYQISKSIETIFSAVESNFFLVQHDDEFTYIKRISARDITDYTIKANEIITSIVPTTEWLKAQGYVTEPYIDEKISALDFINKQDIEEYVSNIVLKNIDTIVNTRVDELFSERLVTESEALDAFIEIFEKGK